MSAPIAAPVEFVPAVNPEGRVTEINAADVAAAQQQGWRMPTPAEWGAYQQQQKFTTTGQRIGAFAEGVGEGVLGPVIPGLERLAGVPAEDILARKEFNPGPNMAGQATGFVAPLVATFGASAPLSAGAAATGTAAKVAAKTLPGLATKAGAAVAEHLAAPAGAGILRRAVPAAADFATQGAILGASNVATQAVLSDPKLSAESALAEVATSAGLGGLLGFGGSTAVHGVAAVLGKAGTKAVDFAASRAGNPETYNFIARSTGDTRAAIHVMDAAGVPVDKLAGASRDTAKLLVNRADDLIAFEKQFPGATEILAKADPDTAARVLNQKDIFTKDPQRWWELVDRQGKAVQAAVDAIENGADDFFGTVRPGERVSLLKGTDPAAAHAEAKKVSDLLAQKAKELAADPAQYPSFYASRLRTIQGQIDDLMPRVETTYNHLGDAVTKDIPGATPAEVYETINKVKKETQILAKFNSQASPEHQAAQGFLKNLSRDVRLGLESEAVWGEVGARQAATNKAYSEFMDAREGLERLLFTGPRGDKEVAATKVNSWMNLMADPRGAGKSEAFAEYLAKGKALAQEMKRSGLEGADDIVAQLDAVKALTADARERASVNQIIKRLQGVEITSSGPAIPTASGLVKEVAKGGLRSIPVVGTVAGAIEGTLTAASRPSYALGVIEAFGKASQRMSDSIGTGVGRLFAGTALKGASEGASALTSGNYTKVAGDIRANASDPSRLADHAHRQTRDWSEHSPGAAQEAEGVIARATQHLASKLPSEGTPGPFSAPYRPSAAEMAAFNRAARIAENPASILDSISRGTVHPDHIEALATIYPALHKEMTIQIMDGLAGLTAKGGTLPFKTRMGLALFLGGNMDPMLDQTTMAATQAMFALARQDEQTGNVEPGSRSPLNMNVAGRMSTPMQASASRSTT